jgi:uncharacterized protein (TIGR03435 family)
MRMKHFSRVLVFAFATAAVHAQTPAPAFEVASVKRNDSASANSSSRNLGGRYTATNVTVIQMLRNAYGIQEFQIAGGPGWVGIDRFDIDATIPAGSKPGDAQLMLQTLLAERFKLTFHREPRQASIYSLVVAKTGHKLTPGDPKKCPNPSGCGFNASPTQIVGDSVSMTQLAARLSRSIGVHVVDNTGLQGLFDLKLEWTIEDQFVGRGASASPTIFPAIQQQLGLRLESTRGPVETLVIDRVERPTEN